MGDNKEADALKQKIAATRDSRIPIKAGVGRNFEEQIHLGDGDIYGDRRAGSYVDDPSHRIHKQGHAPSRIKGCPTNTSHGAEIQTSKWCPLSPFVPTTMAPIRRTYSGRLCATRDSCGFMQYVLLGPMIVSSRALGLWYYWPTMHRDARDMIKKCNDCQSTEDQIPRHPHRRLTPLTSPLAIPSGVSTSLASGPLPLLLRTA
ncbi:reverse transcriptase domain-containing protein [Tanacetum coccineum]